MVREPGEHHGPRLRPRPSGVLVVVERREVDVAKNASTSSRSIRPTNGPYGSHRTSTCPRSKTTASTLIRGPPDRAGRARCRPRAVRCGPPATPRGTGRARHPGSAGRGRARGPRARATPPARRPAPGRAPRAAARRAGRRGVSTASRGPVTEAIRTVGGSASSARSASSRDAYPAGSQRTSAWVARSSASPTSRTTPPSDADRTSAAAVNHRRSASSPGPQRRARGADRRVQQQRRRVAAGRDRLCAGRRDDDRGHVRHARQHAARGARTGDAHRDARERPTELLGGAFGPDPDRAQRGRTALGAPPVGGQPAAPAAGRHRGRGRQPERAVAAPAARRGAAPAARDRGQVARRAAPARARDRRRACRARSARRVRAAARPRRGPRAPARPRSAPAPGAPRGRVVARSAATSRAQPLSTSACASTLRPCPATSSAQDSSSERRASTSRTCGYGARGSACSGSPSSQTTARPRSWTGANADARVPTTTSACPRSAARNDR